MNNRQAVERLVESRRGASGWSERHEALAELALTLAAALDGDAGMAIAAVSRELRATLVELSAVDDGEDAFAAITRRLSAAMGDSAD